MTESEPQTARRELERVLASPGFARNDRLVKFLRFVVEKHLEGEDDEIKESVLAVEVFGRRPDHNSKHDSIVRTEASRLRARLSEYYLAEGKDDPLVIELPKGRYIPVLRQAVDVQRPSRPAPKRAAHVRSSRWVLLAMAGLAVALLVLLAGLKAGGWRLRFWATAAPVHIRSVAVLPFENLSGDPAQEYFTDGMTDAIVTELAQISSLRVISRTSMIRYKGTHKPLPEIAQEVNVDGIVEGAVVRSAERMRVDAQLIQATTDRHLWASTYERSIGDAAVLQSEIARAIANAIQIQLNPKEQAHLTQARSVDPQAYEFYLKGRYFWGKRTPASVQKSIDYFQQAIQKDPNYALAYAGMAEAYATRFDLSPAEQCSKAKAMATAALQMDEGLAEAHNALALCLFDFDDWAGAEREFQRALALNPNYAQAHQWYAQYLMAMGRRDSAVEELKRAEKLDPLSLMISGGSGRYGEQYDLIIESSRKKLELDPNNFRPYMQLGWAYAQKGMYREAIAAYQKARGFSDEVPNVLSGLGYTYGIWGKRAEALKILRELKALSKRRYVSPQNIALVYVGLGEKDLAFDWLQNAVTEHSMNLPSLRNEKEWASVRSDPRYAELLRRIGLPP
jgi:TolB-like protein/Flp pilus assembly protein TadD